MGKRMFKSQNRVLCGVCGGIADFFNIDPTIIRLIMIVLVVVGFGTGIVVYIVAALIMPDRPLDDERFGGQYGNHPYRSDNGGAAPHGDERQAGSSSEVPHSDSDFDNYFNKNKQ